MPDTLVSSNIDDLPSQTCKRGTTTGVCLISNHQTTNEPHQVYSKTQEDESLRQALKLLAPTRDDFRLADYATSFNWPEVSSEFLTQLPSHANLPSRLSAEPTKTATWYAVVFRSKRRTDCNNVDLFEADRLAYNEA
ncbi:hypothetical protein GGI20_004323 [Coemansia sp. BCRC 34301]|nr:hypothetical protein GGI20_004323 [Coemansia sp. BCRC 34301]